MGPLVRSSGIVATVLVVAALASGFLFSARETGSRRRPAWWLDLHNGLGGVAFVSMVVHVAASFLDSSAGIGVGEVFVPGIASSNRWPLAWGVIATYLLAGAVLSTWPRRLRARRLWRVIHVGSTLGVALALVHGYQMGTEAAQIAFRVGLVVLVTVATYALNVRLFDWVTRRWAAGGRGNSQLPHR